jgi:hypothetical protein
MILEQSGFCRRLSRETIVVTNARVPELKAPSHGSHEGARLMPAPSEQSYVDETGNQDRKGG